MILPIVIYTALACTYMGVDISWVYYEHTNRIEICTERDAEEQASTLVHEYGHFIWFKILTQAERDEYAVARQEMVDYLSNGNDYIFYHALNNSVEEDFAETIANIYYYKDQRPQFADLHAQTKSILKKAIWRSR